jgi:hypothetical protein
MFKEHYFINKFFSMYKLTKYKIIQTDIAKINEKKISVVNIASTLIYFI